MAGGSDEVATAGVMGYSSMTGINETCIGNKITKLVAGKARKEDYQVHAVTASHPQSRAEQGTRSCSYNPTNIHNNAGVDGDMAAVRSHLSGTPTTPSGVRFVARKDICQAVSSSPAGFSLSRQKYRNL